MRSALILGAIVVLTASLTVSIAAATGPPRLPLKAAPSSVAAFKCPPKPVSTVDLEACAGHQLLTLDRTFDGEVAALWPLLDDTARKELARAQQAWLTYRDQACEVEARAYVGGTEAPVAYGQCEIRLTSARIKDVSASLALYCQGRDRTGPARHCPRG